MKARHEPLFLWALFISLLLHFLFFYSHSKKKLKNTEAPPIWVEWKGVDNTKSYVKRNQSEGAREKKLSKDLRKALRTDWSQILKETGENSVAQEINDVDIVAHGVELNLEKAFPDDVELPLLWKQIRLHLRYRPEHSLARIQGDVHVRIRVDRQGQLLRIFKESATGPPELLGWTLLCLLDAFSKPFLAKPFYAERTLDLRVQFTMGKQVAASLVRSARMIFVVEGDVYSGSNPEERVDAPKGHLEPPPNPMRNPSEISLLRISTKQMMEIFRDKTLKNHMEWNYFTQVDYYKDQCHRHGNRIACEKLNSLQKTIGD
ncbi:hypothetical protein K2X05_12230 [bacterium]|nr:hypothetical protein [bacterium]